VQEQSRRIGVAARSYGCWPDSASWNSVPQAQRSQQPMLLQPTQRAELMTAQGDPQDGPKSCKAQGAQDLPA
jgi:hypothetical protein